MYITGTTILLFPLRHYQDMHLFNTTNQSILLISVHLKKYSLSYISRYNYKLINHLNSIVIHILNWTVGHLYKGHSINKRNFAQGVRNNEHCLQWDFFFSRKSKVIGSFMSQKTVSMIYLTEPLMQKFFFTRMFPLNGLFMTQVHCGKPMFCSFVNSLFFTKRCFSVHITHTSVNCSTKPRKIW